MMLLLIGYWLILTFIAYLNLRIMYFFEDTWNYKYFVINSWSGIIFITVLYLGLFSFLLYGFITFTEWWFGFNLPLY